MPPHPNPLPLFRQRRIRLSLRRTGGEGNIPKQGVRGLRVCIFSGHTGGHLFPAVAFAESFKERFPQSHLSLITSPKARKILEAGEVSAFDQTVYLNDFPFFSGISLRSLIFLLEFTRGFFLSFRLLKKLKPSLCVGFGSYVSYPGMRLANLFQIPTLIHEQNTLAGKATKMLAACADVVAQSFPQTEFAFSLKRLVSVGLPIRRSLVTAAQGFERKFEPVSAESPLKILVTGGSQGASRLNQLILQSFLHLLHEERNKIAVTHITGNNHFDSLTQQYRQSRMRFKTYPFYKNMQDLYREGDLAITRAGANTLFELALFGMPSIVVPFPHAAENHQELNARYFESRHALVMKEESTLTPEWLSGQIHRFMAPEIRRDYSQRIAALPPSDAAGKLTDLAAELLDPHLTPPPFRGRKKEGVE